MQFLPPSKHNVPFLVQLTWSRDPGHLLRWRVNVKSYHGTLSISSIWMRLKKPPHENLNIFFFCSIDCTAELFRLCCHGCKILQAIKSLNCVNFTEPSGQLTSLNCKSSPMILCITNFKDHNNWIEFSLSLGAWGTRGLHVNTTHAFNNNPESRCKPSAFKK